MQEPLDLILAGGCGTSMDGMSKGDLILGHAILLTHAQARFEPQVAAIAVNTSRPITTKLPVVTDATLKNLSPLTGVLAGLDWAKNQGVTHIATVAVDIPFFPCSLVPHLLLAGKAQPRSFAITATSDGLHGTFGIWPTVLRSDLATFPDTTPPSFFSKLTHTKT